jgi:hypothetical protein
VELTPCASTGPALQIRNRNRRRFTATYFLLKRGQKIRVCKLFFQNTLQIGNTALLNLNEHNFNNINAQLVQRQDLRGKHKPKHAATDGEIEILKEHMFKFPRERSHYTLNKKQTLNPELNVKIMHDLYTEEQQKNNRRALGYGRYLQEFNKFDLKFGSYKTDTCGTCDKLRGQLEADPENEQLTREKTEHLRMADMAFSMQKQDSENRDPRVQAVWADMMSVQQIPKLSTGPAFYLRKYKVYNEDFYMASRNQHHMYLWGQLEGKKGANDVISCLHKFLERVPSECKHLICWFDNTSSQLKNSTTLCYLLHRTDSTSPLFRFEQISLKFAPVGHTYMAPDRAFSTVSKQLKKKKTIGDPHEIMELINASCKNSLAEWVPRMQHYDWVSYLSQYYVTNSNFLRIDDEPLLMRSRQFSFGFCCSYDEHTNTTLLIQQFQSEIRICLEFQMNSPWKSFFVEQKENKDAKPFSEFFAYPDPLILENKRIRDLQRYKDWLPACYRELTIYNLEERDHSHGDSSESE